MNSADFFMTNELPSSPVFIDPAYQNFLEEQKAVSDENLQSQRRHKKYRSAYEKRLFQVYQFLVEPGRKVLELGCGEASLLAALRPSVGVGVDFNEKHLETARKKNPQFTFLNAAIDEITINETFDVIILSDIVNDLWNIQEVLRRCRAMSHRGTRIIINCFNRVWQPLLTLVRSFGLARPVAVQNWVTPEDMENLLRLAGFEVIRSWGEILWPLWTPLLGAFLNSYLVKIWPFNLVALTNFIVARPIFATNSTKPTVSVIVPARNEAGNIESIIRRVPEMGGGTEIIFVEGHSRDQTYEVIVETLKKYPGRNCQLFQQIGKGKGDAVRLGFQEATGDILMILDADLTVVPEDLPYFYEGIASGTGEFINGVRLVYPMEKNAMRFANLIANRFFSLAFSYLLGQKIKDTLCGTKVLWRKDYPRFQATRAWFGDFDPFGDFDFIFAAAKLNLRLVDLPIRYRERTYGTTNIQRWRHGVLLLRMVLFAARRIKFT